MTAPLTSRDHLETCTRSVMLETAPEKVFAFCTSRAGFIAHYPNPIRGYRGAERWEVGSEFWLDYSYLGIPQTWHGKVTELEPDRSFTDVMLSGMFRAWEHTHSVEPAGNGTLYTDTVRFKLGLGRLIDRYIVKRSLDTFFQRRHELLRSALQGNTWEAQRPATSQSSARV